MRYLVWCRAQRRRKDRGMGAHQGRGSCLIKGTAATFARTVPSVRLGVHIANEFLKPMSAKAAGLLTLLGGGLWLVDDPPPVVRVNKNNDLFAASGRASR